MNDDMQQPEEGQQGESEQAVPGAMPGAAPAPAGEGEKKEGDDEGAGM